MDDERKKANSFMEEWRTGRKKKIEHKKKLMPSQMMSQAEKELHIEAKQIIKSYKVKE